MYNINLEKNEEIKYSNNNILLELNNIRNYIVLIITNKRLLILNDINKNNVLSITRKMDLIPKYEVSLSINLKDIEKKDFVDNGTELLYKKKIFFFFDIDLINYL